MQTAALIVAAGRGHRAGDGLPKQYRPLQGACALARCIAAFDRHEAVTGILTVISPGDRELYRTEAAGASGKLLAPVFGGDTRQVSVRLGLESLEAASPDVVLIHDAARPFVSKRLIDTAIASATTSGAAIPVVALVDTIVRKGGGSFAELVPRDELAAVQTPQAFRFPIILNAHRRAAAAGGAFTDDGSLAAAFGARVACFAGDPANSKLTTEADISAAIHRLRSDLRLIAKSATGYDVHAFGPGDAVWLGGVEIPHGRGLVGHSDADVVLHALTDAVLGTIGDGDIGLHFPPTDPQWRGASSDRFLRDALRRLALRSGELVHLDVTIVCEAPKIGPHRDRMRQRIAEIAGLAESSVSVKATTSERLGFTGRGEGIAALATASVLVPAASHG